ncbi:hypothetical protein [Actinokineospora sp.]|uniref:hypothetical protein n=1 Tax=Actinokineospora sp. TaxID=1872133 RepID=UPI004038316E
MTTTIATITDFDFLVGSWKVANRRLTTLLAGSDEWDEFPATCTGRTFFDGAGSADEIHFPTRGFSGTSFRTYDRELDQWVIYWVNSRDGRMQPSVAGRFTNGVCECFGDDEHEGVPIRVRYRWSRITPLSARWEQAFSADGEQTWETNWVMDFTRTAL